MNATITPRVDRRRRRPALACVTCRKSKIRCDRQMPCSNCSKSKNKTCVFDDNVRPLPTISAQLATRPIPTPAQDLETSSKPDPLSRSSPSPRPGTEAMPAGPSTASSTISHEDVSSVSAVGSTIASSSVSSLHVDGLKQRVAELERRLARAGQWTAHVPVPKQPQEFAPTSIHHKMHLMPRGIMSKTRLFGQSHWAHVVILYKQIFYTFQPEIVQSINPQILQLTNKCKSLGQRIKSARLPAVRSLTPPNELPPRHITDQLLDNYIRISESVHRVVHVPSFRERYEETCAAPDAADRSFMVQLHLVMAIGSAVLSADFSMRTTAVRWLVEAQHWVLLKTSFKKRLTLLDLQNMVLLCIARETVGVDADASWINIASVMRSAMAMGLHRDPCRLPAMDTLQAELRRRLWSTIVELNVQSSLDSGCPVMLSLSDFDTEPPADINDADLSATTPASSLLREADSCTDTTICLALRATLPARIAICHYLNDLGAVSVYGRTMELHEDLAAVHRSTSRRLAKAERGSEWRYQCQVFDCTVRRYFLALHVPHQEIALEEPAYAFSRTVILDNAIKIHACYCPVDVYPPAEWSRLWTADRQPATDRDTDLSRLAATGSGSYRWVPVCCSLLISLELQHQLRNEMTLSIAPPRPDALDALNISRVWSLRRIKCGDMNIKGYVFMVAQCVMVEAFLSGQFQQNIPQLLIESATESVRTGFDILEEQARGLLQQQEDTDMPWEPLEVPICADGDWEGMGGYFMDFLGLEPIHNNYDASGLSDSEPWTETYGLQG